MKKIFIDTDIIIDLFAKRDPFYNSAAELFTLIDSQIVDGYISAVIVANLNYILSKLKSKIQAKKILYKLLTLVEILSVDSKIINLALTSNFNDFEDSIQYYTAIENNINYLITRNVKDYKESKIMILTAEEYLAQLNKL